jgi:hypothetical protein
LKKKKRYLLVRQDQQRAHASSFAAEVLLHAADLGMSCVCCTVIAVEKLIAFSGVTSWAPDSSSWWKLGQKNTGAAKLEFPIRCRHGAVSA